MPFINAIIALSLASLLTACSKTKEDLVFTPMSIEDTSAAIYVYRPKAMANAMYSPDFYVDDELKFPVKNGNYSRLTLPAGKHLLKLDAGDNIGQQTEVSVEAETTYYIRVSTSLKINESVTYEPYKRSFMMQNIEQDTAVKELAACCMTNQKTPAASDSSTPDTGKGDSAFSIDKTHNPFSH